MSGRRTALALAAVGMLATVPAGAQEPMAPGPGPQPPDDAAGSVMADRAGRADEDFELSIADRRITEEDFTASTAVEIRTGPSEEQGLTVRVGVLVGARRIDVRLRNVRGHVRFVASLERVQEVIDSHRSEPAAR